MSGISSALSMTAIISPANIESRGQGIVVGNMKTKKPMTKFRSGLLLGRRGRGDRGGGHFPGYGKDAGRIISMRGRIAETLPCKPQRNDPLPATPKSLRRRQNPC